jgi:RNA polymerase sigma-70 factor (ECF subfamily)
VTEAPEEALLASARAGDAAALEELLRRFEPRLLRFGLRMCRDRDEAQDVLQESLWAVARNISGFRGDASLSTWLYTIARSHCIKKRRRSKFAPKIVSLDADEGRPARQVADLRVGPQERLEKRRLREALDQAIANLSPSHRDVLVLRDVEGLPAEEVARVLGLSVSAVKSRLHRARAAVREALAPRLARTTPAVPRPSCPDTVRLFSRHLEGEISPTTCAEMERHLEGCPQCKESCRVLRTALQLCRTTPLPRIPQGLERSIRAGLRNLGLGEPATSEPSSQRVAPTQEGKRSRHR